MGINYPYTENSIRYMLKQESTNITLAVTENCNL